MNLVVDQGNSSAKVALFEQDTLLKTECFPVLSPEVLQTWLGTFHPDAAILSSVKKEENDFNTFLRQFFPVFYELSYQSALPLQIDYCSPQTLGTDRIAAAVGANYLQPKRNLLIIDVGTAITIDFVSASGVYRGGNISPGPELRFKALHQFTGKLPLVEDEGETPALGFDTATAIRSGVMNGIARELDSYIEEFQKNEQVFSFLTGGYAFYFESKLKNTIFADENLVSKGLNAIIHFNEKFKNNE
ncbi:MAG: type III pantothenate kinase [Dysgonamonadaceae bacterium]|jgi:type III pantothenate kinase|nr:type III pantothenate kinase [Dysgonamonadaceae bacterium]